MTDRDTSEMFGEVATALVRLYKRHVFPQEYDHIFYQDNMRIRLTVKRHVTKDDTQPVYMQREPGELED